MHIERASPPCTRVPRCARRRLRPPGLPTPDDHLPHLKPKARGAGVFISVGAPEGGARARGWALGEAHHHLHGAVGPVRARAPLRDDEVHVVEPRVRMAIGGMMMAKPGRHLEDSFHP